MACEDENVECKVAIAMIPYYRQLCESVEKQIRDTIDLRNGGGGVAGVGGIVLGATLAVSGPVGWIIGGVTLIAGGASIAGVSQAHVSRLRDDCAKYKTRLAELLDKAKANCQDEKCIPNVDLSDYCNL